jgi:hypothetical protein
MKVIGNVNGLEDIPQNVRDLIKYAIVQDPEAGELVLKTEFKTFPYRWQSDDYPGWRSNECYGLRLSPESGRIRAFLHYDEGGSVATSNTRVNHNSFSVDLGAHTVHLEVFFVPIQDLSEIGPPAGFKVEEDFRRILERT